MARRPGATLMRRSERDASVNGIACSLPPGNREKARLDALHGIQTAPIDVRDLGELQTKPALRTRTEWYAGMVVKHPKAAARLRWVNNG
jgi:hypothetical protein